VRFASKKRRFFDNLQFFEAFGAGECSVPVFTSPFALFKNLRFYQKRFSLRFSLGKANSALKKEQACQRQASKNLRFLIEAFFLRQPSVHSVEM
jgi:hypothetical protein